MFNTSTEEVDINIGTNGPWSQMQRVAHEFKHADQYLNRKISFDATWMKGGLAYDRTDEIEAFNRQNLFAGESVSAKTIVSQAYSNLPKNATNVNSQIWMHNFSAGKTLGKRPQQYYHGWKSDYRTGLFYNYLKSKY